MKMKHFIPALALAMLCTVPAFAEETADTTMNTDLSFSVSPFFKIHRGTETKTATAAPNEDYSKLNLDKALKANYIVYTNNGTADEKVRIEATCPHSGAAVSAFTGTTKDAYYLIFGNTTRTPDGTSIAAAKTPDEAKKGADNPNAVKIKITPVVTQKAFSSEGVLADTEKQATTINGEKIVYTLTNGIYDFSFTCAQEAEPNTFTTADTTGTYQATVTITQGDTTP